MVNVAAAGDSERLLAAITVDFVNVTEAFVFLL